MQRYLALIITSVITITSIHSLEILSCLIRRSNLHLISFKLSSCIVSFIFVLIMCFKNEEKLQSHNQTLSETNEELKKVKRLKSNFYNLFVYENIFNKENQIKEAIKENSIHPLFGKANSNDDDEECAWTSEKTESFSKLLSSSQKSIINFLHQSKIKSNFYLIIISVLLIHFWIISTYLFNYIISSSSYSSLLKSSYRDNESLESITNLIEIFLSTIGGVGTALFFRNILLGLFEISACNKVKRIRRFIEFNLNTPNSQNDINKGNFLFKNITENTAFMFRVKLRGHKKRVIFQFK